MPRILTLELPDRVYEGLETKARAKGVQLNQLIVEWLTQVAEAEEDPLDKLIGSIESPLTDVAEHHDRYIAQAILEEIRR